MADCELIEKCIFFNDKMSDMPTMADLYKKRYCRTDSSACARFGVFRALGRENVPADLYPNDAERAAAILSV
ncbi:MAG: hypothetical protein CVT67_09930 [Actinobacteria bacterium HGW-Actinobacteria-7]|nr:MAG: hypothetical protein CVT67_09930 [Actinobacteria bacterium HGW-Actinobacteria-7]